MNVDLVADFERLFVEQLVETAEARTLDVAKWKFLVLMKSAK